MKRRIFLFSLPILLLAWFFVFGATARAAEIVIAADTVWTKAQSPNAERRSREAMLSEKLRNSVMWTDGDLNPRPPRCKRGALPTELSALTVVCYNAKAATKPIPKSRRSDWS